MKENIFEKVAKLLKSQEKYISEYGEILKAKVYSDIMTMDKDLIRLLLSDEEIKNTFFVKVEDTLVFDKQKFAWLIDSKEFLPDSYTAYTNKIGLTSGGDFISNRNDVVLDFPYKDCVLEGGQDKDDQKREEIFYNETLAKDEIRRMLDPKVFTKAKRYTKDGVEENITFNEDDNLIIKGNNLIALTSVLKRYEGKVRCIYIDPPYNTGSDSFNYNDSFNHSTWLTFMKNRLEIAKRLLRDDGVIFVQCDDNEQAYLKVLMDEVMGRDNFVSNIIWKGRGGRQDSKFIAQIHEFIIVYSKSYADLKSYKLVVDDNSNYPFSDDKGDYKIQLVRKWGSNSRRIDRPNLYYEVDFMGKKILPILPDGSEGRWRWSKNKLIKAIENNQIVLLEKNGKKELYEKLYKGNGTKEIVFNSWIEDSFIGEGSKILQNIFNEKVFDYPKPESLIELFLKFSTQPNDLVLDFHLGFRVIIVIEANSYVNIRSSRLLPKFKTQKIKSPCAA